MVDNSNQYSRLSIAPSAQITDGADFPHSGIIKALSVGLGDNYAVKTSTGFNITAESSSSISVTAGKVFRDGVLTDVSATSSNLNIGTGGGINTTYTLLVVDASNALAVRTTATTNSVPEYTDGDIPIALILYTANSSTMEMQFLTTNKTSNGLTVGFESGGSFSEALTLKTDVSGNLEITGSSLTDLAGIDVSADRLLIRDATNNRLKLVAPQNVGNQFSGADAITAVEGEPTLDLTGALTTTSNIVSGTGIISTTGDISASAGSVNANVGLTALTGNITASAGNIVGGSVEQTATNGGLSSAGVRTKSMFLAADASSGGYTSINAFPSLNAIGAAIGGFGGGPALIPSKEHYYIGFDSSGASHSHQGGTLTDPTSVSVVGSGSVLEQLTVANATVSLASDLTAHTYSNEEVFGNGALFIALDLPENHGGKTVTLHNITSFALYVIVIDQAADPSQAFIRNKVNGGYRASEYFFNQEGNEKCVNLSEILLNGLLYPATNAITRDAILIKARESVTLQAVRAGAGEIGAEHENDVFWEQGLFGTQLVGVEDPSQWFITGSTGNNGNANVVSLSNAYRHIPIHLTGTAFVCSGTNNILLPNRPPIGTQYSFLVNQGTTNINRPVIATQSDMFTATGLNNGVEDEFYELSASSSTLPLAISAGNGKTFIYTANRDWQVIG
jgi:hypothetical protein